MERNPYARGNVEVCSKVVDEERRADEGRQCVGTARGTEPQLSGRHLKRSRAPGGSWRGELGRDWARRIPRGHKQTRKCAQRARLQTPLWTSLPQATFCGLASCRVRTLQLQADPWPPSSRADSSTARRYASSKRHDRAAQQQNSPRRSERATMQKTEW